MTSDPFIARVRVLFVCHANMCRSPLAHGVFVHLARARGRGDRFDVDSAGTWARDGVEPHPSSVAVAAQYGIDLGIAGVARALAPEDLYRFDHIIAMDRDNEADILRLQRLSAFGPVEGVPGRVRLLRALHADWASVGSLDVPDPIGRGPDAYALAFEIIREGCLRLLDELDFPE
jgi:protein-tyrosine phosphatase